MRRAASPSAARPLEPMPPRFRARRFTDAGGARRFGISVAFNGNRFSGSVPVHGDERTDAAGVAQLLESLAVCVRRG
jgi:hypothetical protein